MKYDPPQPPRISLHTGRDILTYDSTKRACRLSLRWRAPDPTTRPTARGPARRTATGQGWFVTFDEVRVFSRSRMYARSATVTGRNQFSRAVGEPKLTWAASPSPAAAGTISAATTQRTGRQTGHQLPASCPDRRASSAPISCASQRKRRWLPTRTGEEPPAKRKQRQTARTTSACGPLAPWLTS